MAKKAAAKPAEEKPIISHPAKMLPTFPKAQKVLFDAWNKQMFEWKNKTFPLHLHPSIHHILEGKSSDFQREDRKIKKFKMKRQSITASHSIADGKGMTLQIFNDKAKEVGEGLGVQLLQSTMGAVEEAVKETKNEVKIKKGELKQEDILRIYETVQQNFDERGNPTGQLICGSEFAAELRKHEQEWKNDKEFIAKLDAVTQQKREEFNEREARRRLVD